MFDIKTVKVHTLKDGKKLINLLLGPVVFSDGTKAQAQDKDFLDLFKTHRSVCKMTVRGFDVVKVSVGLMEQQLDLLRQVQEIADIVLTPRTVLDALGNLSCNKRETEFFKCLGQKIVDEITSERIVDVNCWVY